MGGHFVENMLTRLERLGNVLERVPEVLAALTLLAEKAAGLHDGCMARRLNVLTRCINRSEALAANFKRSPELYERVCRLMLEAAADSSTYTDARRCQQLANSQGRLQLPCEEFWCNLSSKGVPCLGSSPQRASDLEGKREHLPEVVGGVHFSCSLLRQRIKLTTHGLMQPPSSDLYTKLLRAICKAFDRHQKVDSSTRREAFTALAAMQEAASELHIAATQGSPFEDLQAKVALKLLSLLEDDEIIASPKVTIIWKAISVLDLAAQLDPRALGKFEDAMVRQAPVMSPRQLANVVCAISAAGLLSSFKGSAALISAVAHALAEVDVVRVCTSFATAAKELKAEAWAPFLEDLPGVAAKLSPQGVGTVTHMIGVLFESSNITPDKHTINALLTAILLKLMQQPYRPVIVRFTCLCFVLLQTPHLGEQDVPSVPHLSLVLTL
jgi:hypothetical protein